MSVLPVFPVLSVLSVLSVFSVLSVDNKKKTTLLVLCRAVLVSLA